MQSAHYSYTSSKCIEPKEQISKSRYQNAIKPLYKKYQTECTQEVHSVFRVYKNNYSLHEAPTRIRTSPVTAKALSSYALANTMRPYSSMSKNQRVLAEIACDIANMEIFRVCWNYVKTQQCPCMDARTRR